MFARVIEELSKLLHFSPDNHLDKRGMFFKKPEFVIAQRFVSTEFPPHPVSVCVGKVHEELGCNALYKFRKGPSKSPMYFTAAVTNHNLPIVGEGYLFIGSNHITEIKHAPIGMWFISTSPQSFRVMSDERFRAEFMVGDDDCQMIQ